MKDQESVERKPDLATVPSGFPNPQELDSLVAERVMGWQSSRTEGIVRYDNLDPPRYSTDIAAAMEVAQQVISKGFTFEMRWIAVWMARFDSLETGAHYGFTAGHPATSVAEVICRAALQATATASAQ